MALIWLSARGSTARAQEVIVNAGVGLPSLNNNEVRMLFTMRLPQLPDQSPAHLFVLPDDHPTHARFTNVIRGLFAHQLRKVWDRQTFSGTGQSPVLPGSEQEMIECIASTPAAVGYEEHLSDHPGVRRLAVR